jgi:hypothetical protein
MGTFAPNGITQQSYSLTEEVFGKEDRTMLNNIYGLDGAPPPMPPQKSIESEPVAPVVNSSLDNLKPKRRRRRRRIWDPIGIVIRVGERISRKVEWTISSSRVLTRADKDRRLNSVALWLAIAVVVPALGWFVVSPIIISFLSEKKQPAAAEFSRPPANVPSIPSLVEQRAELPATPVVAAQPKPKPVREFKSSSTTDLSTTFIDSSSKEFSREYELGVGETLSKLAIREWGRSDIQDKYSCIAAANGIEEPDAVQVGQRILIPRDCSKYSAGVQRLEAKYVVKHKATNAVVVALTSDSTASSFFATSTDFARCSADSSNVSNTQDASTASLGSVGGFNNASIVLFPIR